MAMQETTKSNYDTHAAVRRLTEAGMPEAHAEAVVREQAHLIENELATKTNIAALQADIEKHQLKTEASIEKLRLENKTEFESVRADITKANLDLIKWMVGTNLGVAGLIIAAVIAVIKLL